MVVGQKKTLRGDYFAGASASELHDGVLERRVVDAVDLLGREPASKARKGFAVKLFQKGEQPHSFVRLCGAQQEQ